MDEKRQEEILEQILGLEITLASDARLQGPGYISQKITEIRKAVQELNRIGVEIERVMHFTKAQHRAIKSEINRRTRLEILKLKVEGSSSSERKAMAEVNAEKTYLREKLQEMYVAENGREGSDEEIRVFYRTLPPGKAPKTLEQELNYWDLLKEQITAISTAYRNKRRELKEHDAAVRLQSQTIEMELRAFGSTAHPLQVPKIFGDSDSNKNYNSIKIGNQVVRFDDPEEEGLTDQNGLVGQDKFSKLTNGGQDG